ncbi:MAG: hypothetical protein ACXVCP_17640 [Bdellovibrio sp.]
MAKKIFAVLMSMIFPMHVFAKSTPTMIQPNFDEQSKYINQMHDTLSIFNNKNYVDKSFDELKKLFKDKADRVYMQKMLGLGKKPSQLSVKVVHKTIEIVVSGFSKIVLSDFDVKHKAMKINGKEFKVTAGQTLEEINKNLAKMLSAAKHASVMDLFIPKAHAMEGLLFAASFVGLFIVLPIWGRLSTINDVTDDINELINECENRDDSVPFEKSKTNVLLQYIDPKDKENAAFSFPAVASNTECSSWADRVVNILSNHEVSVGTDTALKWCSGIKKANQCVDEYKAGQPKNPQGNTKSTPPKITGSVN